MNSGYKHLAAVRELLFNLEQDMGLDEMSQNEKDILYAFHTLARPEENEVTVHSEAIRTYETVRKMKHATYHRTLKRLLDRGFIQHAPERKAGLYRLNHH
ncbi:MAG: MarR family transcriptional regulator [Pseudomonadota bacterium]|nr:MarR family transcriptional regulator [Pseudomonadota bacterium]MEE3070444.1 MarR family transcriptional regulator [Pseudomonadota bacterium]